MPPFLTFLAILPGLLICFYIYTRDEHDREPQGQLAMSFTLGVLATLPAIFIERWAVQQGYDDTSNLLYVTCFSFAIVGFVEEIVKFLPLRFYAYTRPEFDEPMDGIVHAVMIGMGFATLENLLYADIFGYGTVLLRAFTAVPAHASFAIITGYFVGLAKFDPDNRNVLILKGLGGAILLHGIYDFFLIQDNLPGLALVSVVGLYISIFYAQKLVKWHRQLALERKMMAEQVEHQLDAPVEGEENSEA
jgi:RsiW-degrading membrane proteinase PrsW (M82 family)